MLGGRICRWLFLFQEFDFELIIKLGKQNVGVDHLSRIPSRESGGNLDDVLPSMHLLKVNVVSDQFAYNSTYLATGYAPKDWIIREMR